MLFYCSKQMQNRGLNTCKQDVYSFLRFSYLQIPGSEEPGIFSSRGVVSNGCNIAAVSDPAAGPARRTSATVGRNSPARTFDVTRQQFALQGRAAGLRPPLKLPAQR